MDATNHNSTINTYFAVAQRAYSIRSHCVDFGEQQYQVERDLRDLSSNFFFETDRSQICRLDMVVHVPLPPSGPSWTRHSSP